MLEITAGSGNKGQPHLIAQSLSRILPTPGEPSVGLEVRPDGGLGTVSTSLPTGLEEGGGFYPKNDCGGWGGNVGGVMEVKGLKEGSCVCVCWDGRKYNF